mgnify:CR=1 FL=1
MFWRKPKPKPKPHVPKPMVATLTVVRTDGLTDKLHAEYDGAISYNEPEPWIGPTMVRFDDVWINIDQIDHMEITYEEAPR